MKLIATVNNLPANLSKYAWITARAVDGELWFYGAYGDGFKAEATGEGSPSNAGYTIGNGDGGEAGATRE